MTWSRVRLEAARGPDFPEGSHRHGYEFVLPLLPDGRLDRKNYDKTPELCTVHRFWEGEGNFVGEIQHVDQRRWVFSYAPGSADDESIAHFDKQLFREGEYMTVREPNGREHAFRIVIIEPARGLATRP
jgi:hypothetical protein